MTYNAKVIAGGKIVIPAELRRELGIRDGDSVVIERDGGGGLSIKTYARVVQEVQADVRRLAPDAGGVVDELLAERRIQAAREEAALDAWQKTETPT